MKEFLAICCLFLGLTSFCQSGPEVQFVIQDSIPGKFSWFSVDNFGRIYLAKDDVIQEYSAEYQILFSTSLKSVIPTTIESSKSFRTLVFDQERSVVHFLDNTLTDIYGEIDLMSLDFQQPILVCESFAGNTFWIYDAGAMRLVKLNENLETVSITENLSPVFGEEELPVLMREFNDFLYVVLPRKGVAVFDVFGTYLNTVANPDVIDIDVFANHLVILTDEGITTHSVNARTGINSPLFTYPIPFPVKQFSMTEEKVYFLNDQGLYVGVYKGGKKQKK